MPKIVDIGIFRISKTVVDHDEVKRWMEWIGANEFEIPSEQVVSNPALNIALAAKRCYMSFEAGLNPNVSRIRSDYVSYFDNLLTSKHGSVLEHSVYSFAIEGVSRVFCYHPDTEIFTRSGWKAIGEISDGEMVLTLNPETKKARWSVNHKLHSFDYVGPLLYWKNREDESPKMTPDHTLWCCSMNTRKVRGIKAFEALQRYGEKISFKDIFGKSFFVQNAIGEIEGSVDPLTISFGDKIYDAEKLFEWLGWVATDGTITDKDNTGRHRIRVNQSKAHNIENLTNLGYELFGDAWRITGQYYKAFDVSNVYLWDWCVEMIGRTKDTRNLLPLLNFSVRLIRAFLKCVFAGDGCHGRFGHRDISCGGNEFVAKQYQVLIALVGRASRVSVDTSQIGITRTVNGLTFVNQLPNVQVHEHQRGEGACQVKGKHQKQVLYSGMVYCPQTDDGIVYVRYKDGKALWAGNTAEMNRHRAGWAISEGSLRFIRFDKEIPYWLPTSLQIQPGDDQDLIDRKLRSQAVFHEAFTHQEECYGKLLEIWDMHDANKNFSYKKAVTSCLRRIIGLGVATGGVWSGNIRALRHVIAMRTNKSSAEEEIYHVFCRIAERMIWEEPLMFGDFRVINGSYVPTNWKV